MYLLHNLQNDMSQFLFYLYINDCSKNDKMPKIICGKKWFTELYITLFSVRCTGYTYFTWDRYDSLAIWDMPFIMASELRSRPCGWGEWRLHLPKSHSLFRWCQLLFWLQGIQPHGRVCVNILLSIMVSTESPAPR